MEGKIVLVLKEADNTGHKAVEKLSVTRVHSLGSRPHLIFPSWTSMCHLKACLNLMNLQRNILLIHDIYPITLE